MNTAWEDMGLHRRLKAQFELHKNMRADYEAAQNEVVEFSRPDLPIDVDGVPGQLLGDTIYEGTPVYCARLMATGYSSYMAAPNTAWKRYVPADYRLKGNDQINLWLQAQNEHMDGVYRRSTFYDQITPMMLSGVTVGTPIGLAEEDEATGEIYLVIPHYKENYFGRDRWNNVYPYFRRWEMTVFEAVERFGKDKLSRAAQRDYEQGKFTTKYWFIMGCFRYNDPIFKDLHKKDGVNYRPDRPWLTCFIQEVTDADRSEEVLAVEGYWSQPYFWWDYNINPHEVFARTPAWHAIHDIRGAQGYWKGLWMTTQLEADPAWWVMDTMRGRFHVTPNHKHFVSRDEFDAPPVPFTRGASNYSVAMDFVQHINKTIERWFHKDLFTMLMTWQSEPKAPPTAFMVAHMKGEQAVLLSGIQTAERFLARIDRRFRAIERRAGRLPSPAEFGLDLPDLAEPEFIGALSQLQRTHIDSQPTQLGFAMTAQAAELDPRVVNKLRLSQTLERELENFGYPQEEIVPEDEYQQILQAMRQEEEVEGALARGSELAAVAKDLGGPIDESSLLGRMVG